MKKQQQLKEYNITYLDSKGNELQRKVMSFYTKKEAMLYAKEVLDTSLISGLKKIKVLTREIGVLINFENRNFNNDIILVIGTYNEDRAIKAARKYILPDRFKYISCYIIGESEFNEYYQSITIKK